MTEHDATGPETVNEWMVHRAYRLLGLSAVVIVGAATVVYHYVEDWSWVDSFYFSTIAVTTVGFGDLVPSTDASKLFTILYVTLGIALIGTFLNQRLNRYAPRVATRRSSD